MRGTCSFPGLLSDVKLESSVNIADLKVKIDIVNGIVDNSEQLIDHWGPWIEVVSG
jgi:hypothetical protein